MTTLAYLTADVPGIGGVIKQRPEDFLVEEQPLYEPTGEGEHVYFCVERAGMTTTEAVRRIATAFRVSRREIGFAGMKDKHAVTRQHFTVRAIDDMLPDALSRLEAAQLKPVWVQRHASKLRRGHLAGNRFVIRIREVEPTAVLHTRRMLRLLEQSGVPNYIGEQRFGYRGENHNVGRHLLKGEYDQVLSLMLGDPRDADPEPTRLSREAFERGDYAAALKHLPRNLRDERAVLDGLRQGRSPQQAIRMMDRHQREFLISALQSAMFNAVLDRRIGAGAFSQLLDGDIAMLAGKRSIFAVDAATVEAENAPAGRMTTFDLSPTGPMWGPGMPRPTGIPLSWELDALHEANLTEADLDSTEPGHLDGVRRPTRIALKDTEMSGGVDEHGSYVRLAFTLGRGSFATVVLREIMKNQASGKVADSEDDDA